MSDVQKRGDRLAGKIRAIMPGVLLSGLVAMAAQFVSEHSQAPAMLMAILFGMAISFLGEEENAVSVGITFSAKSILKFGIILLGVRISAETLMSVGWEVIFIVLFGLIATLMLGALVGKLLGQSFSFSVLTAGAVSICGASAALAISSVLPKTENSEKQLFLTVLGVTTLSTIAMIIYPALLAHLDSNDLMSGAFVGATVHDVAQVVGAGYSISEPAGDIATLVKLLRVTLLAPTVIAIALIFRNSPSAGKGEGSAPLLPLFIVGFLVLAALNSIGWVNDDMRFLANSVSKAALLTAIAAVGIKTNLREVLAFGYAPIALIVAETIFIALFAGAGLYWLGL